MLKTSFNLKNASNQPSQQVKTTEVKPTIATTDLSAYERLVAHTSFIRTTEKLSGFCDQWLKRKEADNTDLYVAAGTSIVLMNVTQGSNKVMACLVRDGKLVKSKGGLFKKDHVLVFELGVRDKHQALLNAISNGEVDAKMQASKEYRDLQNSLIEQAFDKAVLQKPATAVAITTLERNGMLLELNARQSETYFVVDLLKESKTAQVTCTDISEQEHSALSAAVTNSSLRRESKEIKSDADLQTRKTRQTAIAQIKTKIGRQAQRLLTKQAAESFSILKANLVKLEKNRAELFPAHEIGNGLPHMHDRDAKNNHKHFLDFFKRHQALFCGKRFPGLLQTRIHLLEELLSSLKEHEDIEFYNEQGQPIKIKEAIKKPFPDNELNRNQSPTYKLSMKAELKQELRVMKQWLAIWRTPGHNLKLETVYADLEVQGANAANPVPTSTTTSSAADSTAAVDIIPLQQQITELTKQIALTSNDKVLEDTLYMQRNELILQLCAGLEKDFLAKKNFVEESREVLQATLSTSLMRQYITSNQNKARAFVTELQQQQAYVTELMHVIFDAEAMCRLENWLDTTRSLNEQLRLASNLKETVITKPREFVPSGEAEYHAFPGATRISANVVPLADVKNTAENHN